MEVRVRSGFEESRFEAVATEAETSKYVKMDNHDLKNQKNPRLWRKVKHEVTEIGRVTLNMLKGQGSKFSYLFIPAFISLLWLVICFITTRNPNVTLEEQYIREYFDHQLLADGTIALRRTPEDTQIDHIHLPTGVSMNVVIAIPFLDVNPIASTDYIKTLEWILIYSTVPIKFHIITNEDSVPYVEKVLAKVNLTSNCDFTSEIVTLSHIIKETNDVICPKLGTRAEFCEILMGNMTPLLFPYLFKDMDHAIYISRTLVFQDNIGYLYPILEKMKRSKEGIAMAPEQTKQYMQAFAAWQKMNPSTKIGRPPPNGKPGFNPDLMVMDLDKLRANKAYRTFFNEAKLNKLVKNYMFHSSAEIPSLGDMVNLMAVDVEGLFMNLGCEWNRNADETSDILEKKYNTCNAEFIHVWNGNPNLEKAKNSAGDGKPTKSRTLVPKSEQ